MEKLSGSGSICTENASSISAVSTEVYRAVRAKHDISRSDAVHVISFTTFRIADAARAAASWGAHEDSALKRARALAHGGAVCIDSRTIDSDSDSSSDDQVEPNKYWRGKASDDDSDEY